MKDDPNEVSANGRLLIDFVRRNNLRILNASSKCTGVVTRQRTTVDRVEKSVIDYIIGCEAKRWMIHSSSVLGRLEYIPRIKYQKTKGKKIFLKI